MAFKRIGSAKETEIVDKAQDNRKKNNLLEDIRTASGLNGSISSESFDELDKRFVQGKLFSSLMASNDFSKSFMTAEYFRKTFGKNDRIDFSGILFNYVKCMESIMRTIITKAGETCEDVIGMSGLINKAKRILKRMNNKIFNDNEVDILCKLLYYYTNFTRNGYIHEEILEDPSFIENVRDNTIYLIYLLLGGCVFSEDLTEEKQTYGEYDPYFNEFVELMYLRREELADVPLKLFFSKNDEGIMCKWLNSEKPIIYDEEGSGKKNEYRFAVINKVEEFENADEENRILIVDYENCPYKCMAHVEEDGSTSVYESLIFPYIPSSMQMKMISDEIKTGEFDFNKLTDKMIEDKNK